MSAPKFVEVELKDWQNVNSKVALLRAERVELIDALRSAVNTFERVQMRVGLGAKHSMIQTALDEHRALLAKLGAE